MLTFTLANPFLGRDEMNLPTNTTHYYCTYNYEKLEMLQRARSIFYFILFVPTTILLGFVLYYFYILKGTNQIPNIQKLWTLRVTSLLFTIVFYDIYLYYLDNVNQTYTKFVISQILRSSFFLIQLLIIAITDPHWLEFFLEKCLWCCLRRRKRNINPPTISNMTNKNIPESGDQSINAGGIQTAPYTSPTSHYSLVDEDMDDEFDRALDQSHPTLRVI
ncbi:unnamed protein product [Didymodactylos carnosus]|uniref:Uncharacterized protein n=1 Tax=Didymodactylos carnosus TaxID=1234261 RepID=A0A816DAU4_9BILA|nr:unnamed protein product [Didymodactylos carnosus]CAF4532731.1 unnamed protein product [Didymodactylos carnosus]